MQQQKMDISRVAKAQIGKKSIKCLAIYWSYGTEEVGKTDKKNFELIYNLFQPSMLLLFNYFIYENNHGFKCRINYFE